MSAWVEVDDALWKEGREARRQNEMVCCQRSGKNDPEQIAASFPQTTRREEGRGEEEEEMEQEAVVAVAAA